MPISKSAKKAMRTANTKRVINLRRGRTMKEKVKATRDLASSGKKKEAAESLSDSYKAIDKALKGGLIKKNTAARKKSRLAAFVKNQK